MKTATFEYTHMSIVDSALADVVYYNDKNYTMALEFKSNGYSTPSVFYGSVSRDVYESLVNAPSLGKAYNTQVKNLLPNLSNGTVYDVNYDDVSEPVNEEKVSHDSNYGYLVHGYVRLQGTVRAKDREEAKQLFLDSLIDEGYDGDDLAVTEVELT